MQVKITMKCYVLLFRVDNIKRQSTNGGEAVEQMEYFYVVGRMQNGTNTLKN